MLAYDQTTVSLYRSALPSGFKEWVSVWVGVSVREPVEVWAQARVGVVVPEPVGVVVRERAEVWGFGYFELLELKLELN